MASSRLIFIASALFADVFIIWVIVSIDFAFPHVDKSFAHALGFLCARDKTGVGLFGTAGIIVLIGAVLTIIAIGQASIDCFDNLHCRVFSIRMEPTLPTSAHPSASS